MAGVNTPVIVQSNEAGEQPTAENGSAKGATSTTLPVGHNKIIISKSRLYSKLFPMLFKLSSQEKQSGINKDESQEPKEHIPQQEEENGDQVLDEGDEPPSKRLGITDMPLDVLYYIAELLEPADRVVLRYTCRAFYESIPLLDADLGSSCLKTLVLARLFKSDLLPEFKAEGGKRDMTLKEIKKFLLERTDCKFCEAFTPKYSPSVCPFHWFIDPRDKMPAARTSPERSLYRRGWFKSLGIDRIDTEDSYCKFLEKAAFEDSFGFTALDSGFTRTWQRAIQEFEIRRRFLHLAREVLTLNCCAHCLNVLPENSGERKCAFCHCTACGFAPVSIVRAEGWGRGRPKYIPIGRMRGRETKFTKRGRVLDFVNDSMAVVGSVFYR